MLDTRKGYVMCEIKTRMGKHVELLLQRYPKLKICKDEIINA